MKKFFAEPVAVIKKINVNIMMSEVEKVVTWDDLDGDENNVID